MKIQHVEFSFISVQTSNYFFFFNAAAAFRAIFLMLQTPCLILQILSILITDLSFQRFGISGLGGGVGLVKAQNPAVDNPALVEKPTMHVQVKI